MTKKEAPEVKPSRKEASKTKWLKRLRSIAVVSGGVLSGAVLLLRGRKKPH